MIWIFSTLLLLTASSSHAVTIAGRDCGGADLLCDGTSSCGGITCQTGDELQGTFTNIGLFSVGVGTRVYIASGVQLAVYASTISIQGIIDGIGRGKSGGSGGTNPTDSGISGFGGSASGSGGGGGGTYNAARAGGGGGAYGGAGGNGSGAGGGVGAAVYGSTGSEISPLSPNNISLGSGGGGGTAGDVSGNGTGGGGGAGGASIYLEASSITINGVGSILISGSAGISVFDNFAPTGHPGGGGGGSGGGLLLRAPGFLELSGTGSLSSAGGKGGNVQTTSGGTLDPGGGGGGGRIKIFSNTGPAVSIALSTAPGNAGGRGGGNGNIDAGGNPFPGSSGTISYGIIASSPTGAGIGGIFISSINWSWVAAPGTNAFWGDALSTSRLFRIFPSTSIAPLPNPQATALASSTSAVEIGLMPNTTYFRFVTAYTDWGDSLASTIVSTHTRANDPGVPSAVFTSIASSGVTVNWTAGSPANPSYTVYSVQQATDSAFSNPSTSFLTSLSSTPAGLLTNTTYFLHVQAINIDAMTTPYSAAFSTATLAVVPSTPVPTAVFITSANFSWTPLSNPGYTPYTVQLSTDNFFTLVDSTITLGTQAAFQNLNPGTPYYVRVKATNLNSVDSPFTTVISTTPLPPGVSSTGTVLAPTVAPGTPQAAGNFSYDGTAVFSWSAAQSPYGILYYFVDIGTLAGANDFIAGRNVGPSQTLTVTGLQSGKNYYARVRAESNAGVFSDFTAASLGVNVYITSTTANIDHPYGWPNPVNLNQGPANIGFSLGGPADVTIKIYTLEGRPAYQTTRHYDVAGNQVITWSGANDNGIRVAPGGYIVNVKKSYSDHAENSRFKLAVLY